MNKKRNNDSAPPRTAQAHRANRGYEINGQWYFELRGGGQKGPFDTEEEMQKELDEFINLHEEMNTKNLST